MKSKWISLSVFTTKKVLIMLMIIFAAVLFREQLETAYDKAVVVPLLSTIQQSVPNDIIFIVAFITGISIVIVLIGNDWRVSTLQIAMAGMLFILYCGYRFLSSRYSYTSFSFSKNIYYADIAFLSAGVMMAKVKNLVTAPKEPVYNLTPFLRDIPINSLEEDKLGRVKFAGQLAQKIQSRLSGEEAGALVIGINGPWGSGKTSFLNLIRQHITPENRIIIDFNPWRSSSSQQIISDFFDELTTSLKPYDPGLSSSLSKYAKSLNEIDENWVTKSIGALHSLFFENETKSDIYNSINSSIVKSKKQIIIFVDDLDRLDKKEIVETLRLIRNSANFNNIVYVVSYDRLYIEHAIKEFNEANHTSFLEKIFQFEFLLPPFEPGILRRHLKEILKKELPGKLHPLIELTVDAHRYRNLNFADLVLKTKRDVVRFSNSLVFEITKVVHDVYFYDFFLLQLLKLKYPQIFEILANNLGLFFVPDEEKKPVQYRQKTRKEAWEDAESIFFMKGFKSQNHLSNDEDIDRTTAMEDFLTRHKAKYALTDEDLQTINFIIAALLHDPQHRGSFGPKPSPVSDPDKLHQPKGFRFPNNTHHYFAYSLYSSDIPTELFDKVREGPFEQYNAQVDTWIGEGKISTLKDKLERVNTFGTPKEFENHLKMQLRLLLKESLGGNMFFIDVSDILNTIDYPAKGRQVRVFDSKEGFENCFKGIFASPHDPPIAESKVIATMIASGKNYGIDMQWLSDRNFSYLQQYCQTHDTITEEFRELHRNARKPDAISHMDDPIREDAGSLFKSFFQQNLRSCKLTTFIQQEDPGSDFYGFSMPWMLQIFESLENFKAYLETSAKIREEEDCYREFMDFFTTIESNQFKPIRYSFKHLKADMELI